MTLSDGMMSASSMERRQSGDDGGITNSVMIHGLSKYVQICCSPTDFTYRGLHPSHSHECARSRTPTFSNLLPYVTARRRAIVPNLLDPELMTPSDRRAEVAAIVATGFLRLRLQLLHRKPPIRGAPPPPSLDSASRLAPGGWPGGRRGCRRCRGFRRWRRSGRSGQWR